MTRAFAVMLTICSRPWSLISLFRRLRECIGDKSLFDCRFSFFFSRIYKSSDFSQSHIFFLFNFLLFAQFRN